MSETKTRFDFEQALLSCWGIVDDIRILAEKFENDEDSAKIVEVLKSIDTLYDVKFAYMFDMFEQVVIKGP